MSSPAGGPIIEASQEPEEYQQALKIILGTVVGVIALVGIIALVLLLYRLWKKQRYEEEERRRRANNIRSVSVDLNQKQLVSVLLLYSDDLPVHEKVAQSLAGFLIESCDCNVFFDLFEEQIIHSRGLDTWLVERLQEADIIMVLCSVGARLRCSKKRTRFKVSNDRTLPDYFAVAVDYVGEKMRVERRKDQSLSKFVTVLMDYSTPSDIPPQLETATKFFLMKDINKLYQHIHGLDDASSKTDESYPVTDKNYQKSEVGTELFIAMEQAKEFFQKNPNWVDDRLEQMPPPSSNKSKSRHHRNNSLEQPLLKHYSTTDSIKPQNSSQINALIEVHTLPHRSNDNQDITYTTLPYSRQNSLPSSLSSHLTTQVSTNQINISKSYEMIPLTERFSDIENRPCVLCGRTRHASGQYTCPNSNLRKPTITMEDEIDSGQSKNKSKSMPTVCANTLTNSQTVFQAEVYKAWDDGGRSSPTDSHETDSNQGSDTLERDIRSITVPPTFDQVHYSVSSYLLNEPLPPSITIVHSTSDHRIRPVPTLMRMEPTSDDDQAFLLACAGKAIILQEL
ncbi:hypothetical protein SNE40_014092 [Patella caerulea]|uniref:SEFIR domain-containing protein n=1 Tax=Patella caerulea TaxID=87958 RepID=A0AAN8PQ17_PATCE